MNTALISLELRKNRLTLIGLAAACALIPPLSLAVAAEKGIALRVALQAGTWWWVIVGLPISAAVFGASAGAGLRSADVREAEAPLPGSAAGRVLRGLAAAVLQFAALALLTAAVASIVSPGWARAVFDFNGPANAREWAGTMLARGLVACFALDLIASCFFASYALGHAFAGGLLGAALSLAADIGVLLALQYHVFFPDRAESFGVIAALAVFGGLAAKAAAIRPMAERFERSRPLGARGAGAVFLLLGMGLLLAWGAEELSYTQLKTSLRLIKPGAFSLMIPLGESINEAEADLYPPVRSAGALADTAAGGLYWIAPDGTAKRLLPDGPSGRFALNGPYGNRVESVLWDRDGRLLVARRSATPAGDKTSFWVGRPRAGLNPVDPALGTAEQLTREGGEVGIRFREGFQTRFCAMADDGRARTCSRPTAGYSPFVAPQYPLAATISKDGRTLTRPGPHPRTWRLPGRAEDLDSTPTTVPAYLDGGKTAYFVSVRIGDDEAVAECLENGAVRTLWKHGWS
ncbi:MAG: hypothetical protein KGL74_11230, partial [Elusimicrobia bacterium]|nr:hypothetical protein [Elusimicrobiota bacterium]